MSVGSRLNSSLCSRHLWQTETAERYFNRLCPTISGTEKALEAFQRATLKDLWNESPNGDFVLIKINKWVSSCSKMKNEVFMAAVLWLLTLSESWKLLKSKKVSHSSQQRVRKWSKWSEGWKTYEPCSHASDAVEIIKHKGRGSKLESLFCFRHKSCIFIGITHSIFVFPGTYLTFMDESENVCLLDLDQRKYVFMSHWVCVCVFVHHKIAI